MEQIRLTVRQLNMYVKSLLEGDVNLSSVILVGELSNFKNHFASGHLYFALKDGNASIKAVMFKGNAQKINFVPQDGMEVVCRGYVSLYERDGQYQFYAETMSPLGQGDIALEFERIKAKLESEGLFKKELKRSIPQFPEKIGVITSDTGAALQDIINISSRRFPLTEIVLFPALVQGINAPKSLISALNRAYKRSDISVIIIGRGGGSAEDLSCFNDETLARKISESPIPVISAVGHETDFSICDFVADLRAPTPSAAAELALPSAEEIKNFIEVLKSRIKTAAFTLVSDYYTKVQMLLNRRCFQKPTQMFVPFELRLDRADLCLKAAYKTNLQRLELRLENVVSKIEALAPDNTLNRGFSLTFNKKRLVKSYEYVNIGDSLEIKFSKGSAIAEVREIKE